MAHLARLTERQPDMWFLAIRSVAANKRRLVGTSLAVLLSVGFLSGTIVLGDTMSNGFDAAYGQFNAPTDVIVRSSTVAEAEGFLQRDLVPIALIDDLSQIPGVASIEPQIEGVAQILNSAGEPMGGDGPPTFGGGWSDSSLNPFRLTDGRSPTAPGEVVIDQGTAKAGGLKIGSHTTVLAPSAIQVTIVGIAAVADVESLGGATFTFFAPEVARELLVDGKQEATALVIGAEDGVDAGDLSRRVSAALPNGYEALTGNQLTREQVAAIGADFLDFLRGFLLVFSGVAMLVATFSINNTFSVLIAHRSRESALLRAVGATRRQVVTMIAIESAVLGLVASAAGACAGVGLAQLLLTIFQALGLDLPTDGLHINPAGLAVAAGVGFVTTVFAGIFPAIEAGRIPPIAALRSAAAEALAVSRVRLGIGSVTLIGGLTVLCAPALGWWDAPLGVVAGGAVLVLVGAVVSGPGISKRASSLIAAPLSRFRGVTGDLARQNAMRSPRRTARTATALIVGVGVVTLFTVFGSSLVASVDQTVAGSLRADFVVGASGFTGPGLDPQLVQQLKALDEVEAAASFSNGAVRIGGVGVSLIAVETATLSRLVEPEVIQGSLGSVTGNAIAVSEALAKEKDWTFGERVEVAFGDGSELSMQIGAIYTRAEILGDLVMPTDVWELQSTQPSVRQILVLTAARTSPAEARTAINTVGSKLNAPKAQTRTEFIEEAAGEVRETMSIIYVLLALSVVIAVMGITNTISLSVHERRREIGLLRAVGQLRGQTRAMIRWEGAVISIFGTVLGMLIGLVAAWGLVSALSDGPELGSFSASVGQLGLILAIGGIVGMAAGVRPARRASRLDLLDAINS